MRVEKTNISDKIEFGEIYDFRVIISGCSGMQASLAFGKLNFSSPQIFN